jgi:predicted aspartyl protease
MTDEDKNESETEYALYNMTGDNNQLLLVRPLVNGKQLAMEVDTGATLSIIGRQT